MTRFRHWLVASLVLCFSTTAHAQTRTVSGSVHDADTGEPLVGAQIAVRGNPTLGTLARNDGNFSLTLPTQDVVLVVKRLGYPLKEVAVASGMTSITVVMHKDVLKLDQIVVTGQASGIARRNLANSVASVDAEQLTKVPAVRGTGIAVSSQESPVNRIADLNPDDIEDIEVLKGAAAAAIYGSKASGGVIMITTKRGRTGSRPDFSIRSSLSTARLTSKEGSRQFPSLAAAKAVFDPSNTLGDAFWSTAYNPSNNFSYEDLIFGEKPLNYETALNVSGVRQRQRRQLDLLHDHEDAELLRFPSALGWDVSDQSILPEQSLSDHRFAEESRAGVARGEQRPVELRRAEPRCASGTAQRPRRRRRLHAAQ
ncbi:MAG: hypothetical protein DMD26_15690 [Gemmatimonadetes bacterium]|nr:MAG: hypothetical protein DMD26_15690 [Gemmatimonadota bacterium]